MSTNPHLKMANDVMERMFGLPPIAPPNELAALETSEGITAQDADMSPDEEALQTLLRG